MVINLLRLFFALAGVAAASVAQADPANRFEVFGPGGGGQMYGTGISPHDPNLMHVSCDMGTFYVSQDGGEHWYMVDQMEMQGIKSTRPGYHPTDPNTLYMPYVRGTSQFRVSHDRGMTWQTLCNPTPWSAKEGRDKFEYTINAIDFDAENAKLMFVSTPDGLYRSLDEGKSFTRCDQIQGIPVGVHVSTSSPRNARQVIAATSEGIFVSTDSGATWAQSGHGVGRGLLAFAAATDPVSGVTSCYAAASNKIYASHDSGTTFSDVTPDYEKYADKFRFLTMSRTDPKTVYMSNMGAKYGVWKSTDGAATWTQIYARGAENVNYGWIGRNLGTSWGGRANRITCDPNNPDLITYVNTMEFFRSTDGGKSWDEMSSDYAGADPNVIDPQAPWAGVGLEVALPTNVVFDPFIKDRMYATYGDLCLVISSDRGKSWRRSVTGIPKKWYGRMFGLVADPEIKGTLYAAASGIHDTAHDLTRIVGKGGGMLKSTDHGETWTVISEGLDTTFPCTSIVMDPESPKDRRTLYCVVQTQGVFRSDDGGATWHRKSEGVGRADNPNVLQVKMASDGSIYAMVEGRSEKWKFNFGPGGLWRSTDRGETWTEVTASVRMVYPKEFALDPHDPKRILIATTQAPGGERAGLWETTNGGRSWKQILSTEQTGKELYAYIHSGPVSFHPTDKNLIYYSTKTHGTWISRDNARTWSRMLGVPRLGTHEIVADPDDPSIIYVTSVGLWKGPAKGY